jgi:hypothetical protein
MSKPNIKKLKYPLWYNIVFAILTVVIPLGLFVYECLTAAHTQAGVVFKVSFVGLTLAIVAWLFLNHFVIKKFKEKINAKQLLLEHDYSAQVGNPDALKAMWYANEKWLTLFEIVGVLLYGGLGALILVAVQSAIIKVKGIIIVIAICYIIAYTLKYLLLIMRKETYNEANIGAEKSEANKDDNTKHNS